MRLCQQIWDVSLDMIEKLENSGIAEVIELDTYEKTSYFKVATIIFDNLELKLYSETYQKLTELENENNK